MRRSGPTALPGVALTAAALLLTAACAGGPATGNGPTDDPTPTTAEPTERGESPTPS
ncbi:iron-siderophore ABC transporter substrate-binding protein, partial [Streptomyces sp. OF8]|nr:iron-siderophore ABC transporter substrate-binding protein [Streptomyces alkaliterrae]